MEIERKFILKKGAVIPPELADMIINKEGVDIVQHYISISPAEIRIRSKNNKEFTLTIKTGDGMVREEKEISIPKELFEGLKSLSIASIEKTRYKFLNFEVDVYNGLKEITVEVEFDTIEDANAFQIPKWLDREVTEHSSYKNRNLALKLSR